MDCGCGGGCGLPGERSRKHALVDGVECVDCRP